MSTDDDIPLGYHLKNTNQRSEYNEAKRKCFFKSAGQAARNAGEKISGGIDDIAEDSKTVFDKTGIGEFFKSLFGKR